MAKKINRQRKNIVLHQGNEKFVFPLKERTMKKICHQKPERSFFLFGKKMPLCSRCFGLYLSFLIGLIISLLKINQLMQIEFYKILVIMVVSFLLLIADGLTQLKRLRQSNNFLRFFTGLLCGGSAGVFIVYVVNKVVL